MMESVPPRPVVAMGALAPDIDVRVVLQPNAVHNAAELALHLVDADAQLSS